MAISLLPTKLHIARTKGQLTPRSRLLEPLNRAVHYKLILLSASAGYGKSTLLSQWVAQRNLPVAWLSLDKEDNEPRHFLIYLINAFRTCHHDFGQSSLELLTGPQQPEFLALITGLIHEMSYLPGEIVLVLDDYQLIEEMAIHEAMTLLLNHLPAQL